MQIGAVKEISLRDYPGRLSCCVFLVGCNFRCPWCDVPQFVAPEKKNTFKEISHKYFFNFLKEKQGVLKGVVLSGGEPTIHSDLQGFCSKIKQIGYDIKLDTNGSNPVMLADLIDRRLVDYIALDIKAPESKYGDMAGFDEHSFGYFLENIYTSIKILKQDKVDYEFCTTLTPLTQKSDILEIARWLRPVKRYRLKVFNNTRTLHPNFSILEPHPSAHIHEIQQAIAPFIDSCEVSQI